MKNLTFVTVLLLTLASMPTAAIAASHDRYIYSYAKTAEQFMAENPLEKVYLHIDNTSYFVEDTVWFKAYVVNATENKPTKESQILHVELLNPEGVIVSTQKYRLKGGKCAGSLPISKELLSGFFEIRAYTKAMLNFGEQNYFTRVFPVFEGTQESPEILDRLRTVGYTSEKQAKKEVSKSERYMTSLPEYNITFYPEGGNLVMGLWSTVAFQVQDQSGKPVAISGKIYDNSGAVVADVRSEHLGIGTFELMPNNSRYYMMIDGDNDGTQYDLPQSFKKGSVVSIDNVTSDKSVEISVNSVYSSAIGVVIVSRGEVLLNKSMTKGRSLQVSKSKLHEGVNQVVLFDLANGKEIASRLFYVKNSSQPKVYIEAQQSGSTSPNAQQEVNFKIHDKKGDGVATNFSLAIYDDETLLGNPQNSLYTSLLLSSEVRGYIPNADYYFEVDDEERSRNLDLVMMVYGWSRYKWETMVNSSVDEELLFKYEKTLSIYGRVFNQKWETYFELGVDDARNNPLSKLESLSPTDHQYYSTEVNFPSKDITPYSDPFIINFASSKDTPAVYNPKTLSINSSEMNAKMLSRKNKSQSNRFNINYSDFFEDVNVAMNLNLLSDFTTKRSKDSQILDSGFFILDSEFRPDERYYDYDEVNLGYELKPMVEYPVITTRYYNRGKYSPFYDTFNFPIFDQLANKPYTSLERFVAYYCNDEYIKSLKQKSSYYNEPVIDNGYTSPNELLYYNKQPFGTISYFATMVDERSNGYNKQTTMPLGMEVSQMSGNYVIDSTVIYNSLDRRTELYEIYRDDIVDKFRVYTIKELKYAPEEISTRKIPDYIVEHFGRLVDVSKGKGSILRDVQRDQRMRVFVFQSLESSEREFYSPDYSAVTPPTSGDHRRTLYWNPNVESDAEGTATVTFYNNSQGSSYTIDAQTITANGEIGVTTR